MTPARESLFGTLFSIYSQKHLLVQLTQRDFKSRYAGSLLGLVWAFLQPLAMTVILWFVFTFGLKAQVVEPGIGFVPWFFAANVAWLFFQDAMSTSTNAIQEYAFLVKKVSFRLFLLPVVKLSSSLILHLIFLGVLIGILLVAGVTPQLSWLMSLYFTFCLLVLLLGAAWMCSALNVFSKDVGYLIGVVLQFGFWMTPIVWNYQSLPEQYRPLVKFNPLFYVTEGYRGAFLHGDGFYSLTWHDTGYFWLVTLVALFFGHQVFGKLKPHFADML